MKKTWLSIFAFGILVFVMTSCLTVETKIYTFKFTGENSGTLTIKYVNIMSIMDDTLDVSQEDFDELISSYMEGDMLEQDYPGARLIDKQLFKENGQLCAEVVFEFDDLESANLFQYNGKGPYMYCLNCSLDTEVFEFANGTYGGDAMPVVFWEEELPVLNLTTLITAPDETTISLLPRYLEWNK